MSAPAAAPPSVKGWCPGALRPMESGDGLIVRVRVTGGILSADLVRRIAEAALAHGNGTVDLSQRGNLQIRGVRPDTLDALHHALAEAGVLDDDPEAEAIRNVVPPPLAGIDPAAAIDGLALVRALESRLTGDRRLRSLPGKFGVVVDDGGCLSLSSVAADIRLVGSPLGVHIAIGGDGRSASPVALVDEADAADAAAALARAFLTLRAETGARRMRDLVAATGSRRIAALAGLSANESVAIERAASATADYLGDHGFFVGAALPFGRIRAERLVAIADLADDGLRLTPFRSILLPGTDRGRTAALAALGLIVDPADPRLAVVACPGRPDCPSGEIDTRAVAEALAPSLGGRSGVALHVSGCAKGCARPEPTALTIVGRNGGMDLVLDGRAGDHPDRCNVGLAEAIAAVETPPRPEEDRTMASKATPKTADALSEATRAYDYERDGAAIYRKSFAIIRSEADLSRFSAEEEKVAVRIIHACGMVDVAADIVFTPGAVVAARDALRAGAPILCDAKMVANGVTRARLPADNRVICTLDDPRTAGLAADLGTTRSAAAMDLWRPDLAGAVVAIGNAPTSLFRLFEMIDAGAPMPAAVIGMPVGFVGAAESKEALLADGRFRALVVRGRRGGSAMTAAAVNALASERE